VAECVLSELATFETATFHRGDVVCLRTRGTMSEGAMERLSYNLKLFTERTGVDFLILTPEIDVVIPMEAS
jgi:hypothetical protein